MGDHHDGRPKGGAKLKDKVIKHTTADRVQPPGGLIKEEYIRVESHGAGYARPFFHSAAYL
ncbi:MAG: hypothetical protein A4E62_00364 [Syntrophorhabdus sp. PtaU1.Bin002]|nr:MAG: hypothetical protein A4E62_00364 [Syntrophorhabdus sp. PtaU1.Bin002]